MFVKARLRIFPGLPREKSTPPTTMHFDEFRKSLGEKNIQGDKWGRGPGGWFGDIQRASVDFNQYLELITKAKEGESQEDIHQALIKRLKSD